MAIAVIEPRRLPDLREVTGYPKLFFVLSDSPNGEKLLHHILNSPCGIGRIRCEAFASGNKARKYCERNGIKRWEAVLFSDAATAGKCYELRYHPQEDGKGFVPCWEVAVSKNFPEFKEERIASIARQVRSVFCRYFLERIDLGKLPWGEHRKVKARQQRAARRNIAQPVLQ